MSYRTVIFDLDGTLLDTLDDLTDSVNHAMDVMGWPRRDRKEIRLFLGNGIRQLMKLSSPEGIDSIEFDRAFKIFKEYYDIHNQDKTRPYDGTIEMMRNLKAKGIKMAIVSNKVENAVIMLRDRFFSEVVDIAIGDAPGMERKPAPDSCNKALALLGSSKEEAVYVGDSEVDLATARNSGLKCISVLWGFRDEDFLVKEGAEIFARTPEDVEREVLE